MHPRQKINAVGREPPEDTVHRIDMINAFDAIPIPLMYAVYADVQGYTIGLRGAASADGRSSRIRPGPVPPFVLVRIAPAQIVQMGNRKPAKLS